MDEHERSHQGVGMPSDLRDHLVGYHGWKWQRVGGAEASIIHAVAHKAPTVTVDMAMGDVLTTRNLTAPAEVLSRYRGAMLGLAVGNSLGVELEGWTPKEIRAKFPGGHFDVSETERYRPWDDDVAQAVIIAEALLEDGKLDVGDLGHRLVRWAEENGRGIGILTAEVISGLSRVLQPLKQRGMLGNKADGRLRVTGP